MSRCACALAVPILPAATHCLPEADCSLLVQVMMGAAAVLSNGTVISRVGAAAVAMMAHARSKPVLICCETYKFHEKVQLDSITSNELGDPEQLVAVSGRKDRSALQDWQNEPGLGEPQLSG